MVQNLIDLVQQDVLTSRSLTAPKGADRIFKLYSLYIHQFEAHQDIELKDIRCPSIY